MNRNTHFERARRGGSGLLLALIAVVWLSGPVSSLEAENPSRPAAPSSRQPIPEKPVSRPFGTLADGTEVFAHMLRVPGGWEAEIIDYGAILTRFLVPGAEGGDPVDVVLGFDSLEGYLAGHPYFGATCGRVSNRIAGGVFELDGKTFRLATNNGANHLHGGNVGFDKKLWKAAPGLSRSGPFVTFSMLSPDGEEGYPGDLAARVTYTLTPAGELLVDMEATTDAATVVNMVHHSYWNLAGQASGSIRGHELAVRAERYLPVDAGGIPTGAFSAVEGTPFDFRPSRERPATLGEAIDRLPAAADGSSPGGVDHDFVVEAWKPDGVLRSVATLRDPASGRSMDILSDQPGLQVYTGNYLDGTLIGKGGAVYGKHAAVCLETQRHPDSVHHPDWPSMRLDPGGVYRHRMIHRFAAVPPSAAD
jgi:aldose 1-epimerase